MSAARLVATAALSAAFANACATAMADAVDVIVRHAGVCAMPEADGRVIVHAGHAFSSFFSASRPGVGLSHPGAGCDEALPAWPEHWPELPAHSSSLEL